MADLDAQQLTDALTEALKAAGSVIPVDSFTKLTIALDKANKSVERFDKTVKLTVAEEGLLRDAQKQQVRALDALNKKLKDNQITHEKYRRELDKLEQQAYELEETLGDLDDAVAKEIRQKLEDAKKASQRAKQLEELYNSFFSLNTVSKSIAGSFAVLNRAGAAIGSVVKGLQDNSSGMGIAGGVMTAGIEAAGDAGRMLGNTMGSAGAIMAGSTNPYLKGLGIAAAVAGPAVAGLADSASKLAKFGVEVLLKEVEKSIKAFQDSTSAGAMFADGITGLRNAAGESGLTVEQFSGVLKSHSEVIAASGMGVTEGAKKMGAALKAGGEPMKTQLLNLGYSFEEQAGLVAETMKDMKGSTMGPLRATNAQVAEQTQRYAENLRTIASITGEDAKKKMEQVRQQASQLAFQQKLAQKSPEQQAAIMRAMSNMSEIERKNFMDMVNFGNVINKEGAVAASLSSGLRDSVSASYDAFQNNTLDDIKQRDIAIQYGGKVKEEMLALTSIGIAGAAGVGGLVQSLSESMGKELQFRNAFNEESIKAGAAATKGQAETVDAATKAFRETEIEVQKLKVSMQDLMTGPMTHFSIVAAEITKSLSDQITQLKLGKGMNPTEGPGFWDKYKGKIGGALGGAATGASLGAAVGAPVFGVGAVPAAVVGGIGGAVTGWLTSSEGKASGGIASGPMSGYIEKLHGTELVLPMSGSKIDTSSRGYAELTKIINNASTTTNQTETTVASPISAALVSEIAKLNDKVSRQISLTEQSIDYSRQLLDATNDHKSVSTKIFNASI